MAYSASGNLDLRYINEMMCDTGTVFWCWIIPHHHSEMNGLGVGLKGKELHCSTGEPLYKLWTPFGMLEMS